MTLFAPTLAMVLAIFTLSGNPAAPAYAPGTTASDLQHRSRETHWPNGFDPAQAQSFAHNDLLIRAGCNQVWGHLIDISKWPSWLLVIKNAKLLDSATSVAKGTRFQWNILGYQEESKVEEFVPASRLGWYSYTPGQPPLYYHTWLLEPAPDGCRVTTEEVGLGPDAAKSAKAGDSETHRVHDLWLACLRWISGS